MSQQTIITCNKCGAPCDASRRLWREVFGIHKKREALDFCELHGREHDRYLTDPTLSIEGLEFERDALQQGQRELARDCEAKADRIVELEQLLAAATAPAELPSDLAVPVEAPAVEAVEAPAVEAPAAELGEQPKHETAAAPVVALQDTPPAPPAE